MAAAEAGGGEPFQPKTFRALHRSPSTAFLLCSRKKFPYKRCKAVNPLVLWQLIKGYL
jgi:hypothetical protein